MSMVADNIDPEALGRILNVEVAVIYYNMEENLNFSGMRTNMACADLCNHKTLEFDILFTKDDREFTVCIHCPLNFPSYPPFVEVYFRLINNSIKTGFTKIPTDSIKWDSYMTISKFVSIAYYDFFKLGKTVSL